MVIFSRLIEKIGLFFRDEKFQEILHGSIYSFSAKIIAKLIGIITSIIAARYYGAEMIGFVALLNSVSAIAGLFANFGMSMALLRLIPEYKVKFSEAVSFTLYTKILRLVIFVSLFVASIVYLLSGILANDIYSKPDLELFIALMAITIIFQSINQINVTMFRVLKKIKLFALTELLPKIISAILLVVLTFVWYDYYNLAYITVITPMIVSLLFLIYILTKIVVNVEKDSQTLLPSYQSILALSFPMFMTNSLQVIMGQSDVVMIGIFRSTSELGVYSIVFTLAMLISFVLTSVNVMAAPKFSELFHHNKMDELVYIVEKSSKLMFWVTLPIIIILVVLGKLILGIWGEAFVSGYTALVILVVGQFINAASGSVGYIMNMVGYQKQFRNIVFVAVIVNISLNYLLIPIYGIVGAAWATAISIALWNLLAVLFIRKRLGFWSFYLPKIKYYISS